MRILIETIPHESQRYKTCGDWILEKDGTLHVLISETGNDDYNFMIGIHEVIEQFLCKKSGIAQQEVDEFDMAYEERRKKSITTDNSEPGDNRFAPYERQHNIASGIERILCAELGVKYQDYETTLNSL